VTWGSLPANCDHPRLSSLHRSEWIWAILARRGWPWPAACRNGMSDESAAGRIAAEIMQLTMAVLAARTRWPPRPAAWPAANSPSEAAWRGLGAARSRAGAFVIPLRCGGVRQLADTSTNGRPCCMDQPVEAATQDCLGPMRCGHTLGPPRLAPIWVRQSSTIAIASSRLTRVCRRRTSRPTCCAS
jgi:hypothetical protein